MSKRCPKCNNVLSDNAVFCGICGTKFANQANMDQRNVNAGFANQGNVNAGYANQGNVNPGYASQGYPQQGRGSESQILVGSGETVLGKLASSPWLSFLAGGGFRKSEIYFTEKRLYATIRKFTLLRGVIMEDFITDLKDVTATQVRHYNPIQYFIWAAVIFIMGIIALANGAPGIVMLPTLVWMAVLVVFYFMHRGVLVYVAYPGQHYTIRIKNESYRVAAEFHQKLRTYIEQQRR